MGWKRRGGSLYYYRQFREDGKVKSHYLPGNLGVGWADVVRCRREQKQMFREFRDLVVAEDKPIREVFRESQRIAALFMIAAGYHKPRRQWRRIKNVARRLANSSAPVPPQGEETQKLFDRAGRGDESCRDQVVALLADGERGECLIHGLGSLANIARENFVKQMCNGHILLEEAMSARFEHLREMIAGPNCSPLEMLLAEAAALEIQCHYRYQNELIDRSRMNREHVLFLTKLLNSSHRRLMSTFRTLARVRGDKLPDMVQFNIAQGGPQQVVNG